MAQLTLIRCAILTLIFASVLPRAAGAEPLQLVEQKIKAGLLYNFLKYTEWPGEAAQGPLVVCLYGGDPYDGHLAPMAGRTVNQHSIDIRKIDDAADFSACALLVINAAQKPAWAKLRAALEGRDVLTVSDFEGFAADGGMIEFARADDRVVVKVNMDAVGLTHLKVHDRLLKLATIVRTAQGEQ